MIYYRSVQRIVCCYYLLLVTLFVSVTSDVRHNVNIAVILPYNPKYLFSMRRTRPAIDYAINTAQTFRNDVTYTVRESDSNCSSVDGALRAFDFYRENLVDVFFGPACDFSLGPVARYAPYWNIPVLSAGGLSHDYRINKRTEFSILTRTGATFDSLARTVRIICEKHRWRSLTILNRHPDSETGTEGLMSRFCFLQASAFLHEFRTNNFTYDHFQFDERKGESEYKFVLHEKVGNRRSGKSVLVH